MKNGWSLGRWMYLINWLYILNFLNGLIIDKFLFFCSFQSLNLHFVISFDAY